MASKIPGILKIICSKLLLKQRFASKIYQNQEFICFKILKINKIAIKVSISASKNQ